MDYLAVAIAGIGCMGLGIVIGFFLLAAVTRVAMWFETKLREW